MANELDNKSIGQRLDILQDMTMRTGFSHGVLKSQVEGVQGKLSDLERRLADVLKTLENHADLADRIDKRTRWQAGQLQSLQNKVRALVTRVSHWASWGARVQSHFKRKF